jgi:hypothetical protein
MIFSLPLAILSLSGTPVAGGTGATERLQTAIDACPTSGCLIELPDSVYPMTNQLWIEGKSDLKIVGTGATKPVLIWDEALLVPDSAKVATLFLLTPPAGGGRPKLPKGWWMWPYAYKSGVGTASDSSVPYSTTGYQHAAMILVKKSARISLENLVVDGRKPAAFMNATVWDGEYDLYFGSVGISLLRSLAVDVRSCEIRNFWTGLYINNRNPSCQAWKNMIGRSDTGANPWSACGIMGGHLIERNRIHANWWAVYSESEWDQGSAIRENLAWDNANQVVLNPANTVSPLTSMSSGQTEDYGGFLYSKDDLMPAYSVTHNTIYGNLLAYGFDMYRFAGTALWSDNLVQVMDSLKLRRIYTSGAEALDDYEASGNHIWHNTLLSYTSGSRYSTTTTVVSDTAIHYIGPVAVPRDTIVELVNGKLVDRIEYDTVQTPLDCGKGCSVKLSPPDTFTSFSTPWSLTSVSSSLRQVQVKGPDSLLHTEWISSPNGSDSANQVNYYGQNAASAKDHANWVCRFCNFLSSDPTSPDFLMPDSSLDRVKSSALRAGPVGGRRGALGPSGALGSHVPVRLRARGLPTYNASRSVLQLPVSISSEAGHLDAMAVAKIQVLYHNEDSTGKIFPVEYSVAILPSDVQPFLPTDTVITIPWKAGSYGFNQIDVWTVGISGGDTLAATPMSWAWTGKAKGGTFQVPAAVGTRTSSQPVRIQVGSGFLRLQGYAGATLRLIDATGAVQTLATRPDQSGCSVSTREMRPGIWFAPLPGGTQRILIAP